jgi:hypothetical protein
MKLEVGMYVRTKQGIGKIDETRIFLEKYFEFHLDSNKGYIHSVSDNTYWNDKNEVIGEPSHNIIDLIEEGDYVNGEEIIEILLDGKMSRVKTIDGTYFKEDIKSIVTKEQFESMSYKIN